MTFFIILAMSSTYYYLFSRSIQERSHQNVVLAFNLIFNEFETRVNTVLSKIEEFTQESLLSPMYVVQILHDQYAQSGQEWSTPQIRKIITHLSKMSLDTRKFGVLVDAAQVVVYGKQKNMLVAYGYEDEEELAGVYLPTGNEGIFVLNTHATEWYGSLKEIETIRSHPLPARIPPVYQGKIPSTFTATFATLGEQTVTIKIVAPIFQNEIIQGVCVLHLEIRQRDVERYARVSQMEVNVFANNALSKGTLPDYRSISLETEHGRESINFLTMPDPLPVRFSDNTIGKLAYYQGALISSNAEEEAQIITVLSPRHFEEEQKHDFFILVAGITLLFSVIAIAEAFGLSTTIVRPITRITEVIKLLTQGDLKGVSFENIPTQATRRKLRNNIFSQHSLKHDEIQTLERELQEMVKYLQTVADAANRIAQGEIKQTFVSLSERDVLGNAFQNMTDYLQKISTMATTIAEGNLRMQIALRSKKDTFGVTMRTMTRGLQSLIQQIRTSAEQITTTGDTIASLTGNDIQIVQNVQSLVGEMVSTMREMGNSVEEVVINMEMLLASVEETSHAVSSVTDFSTDIASNTDNLAQQTQKTISAINTSLKTITEVTERTETSKSLSQETMHDALEGQQAVEQVRASMDTIQKTHRKTVETMTRFEQLPREIGTILDVIQDITEQSSLLALNASIIAAQAGSHGRGFSVIAEEMRNLANGVNASTKDIATIVQTVQQETNNVVQMIREVTTDIDQGMQRTLEAQQTLEKIIASVQRTSGVVTEIADALRQHRTTNHTIIDDVDRVHSMMDEMNRSTNEQKANISQINEAIKLILGNASQTQEVANQHLRVSHQVLNTLADKISNLTNKNLESSRHINQTTTADLAEQAQILLTSVDRFQVETTEESDSFSEI